MQDVQIITMSSLLAGLFINSRGREVNFSTISKVLNDFSNNFDIDVEETDEDIDKLYLIVKFADDKVILSYEFNDLIRINNHNFVVYDYLYDLTDEWIRDYFNIDKSILKTFNSKSKRTRVIA